MAGLHQSKTRQRKIHRRVQRIKPGQFQFGKTANRLPGTNGAMSPPL
jgi:hypothetical protein